MVVRLKTLAGDHPYVLGLCAVAVAEVLHTIVPEHAAPVLEVEVIPAPTAAEEKTA